MKGEIVVLVENSVRHKGLLAEHGLSFYIKTEEGALLFDTGQSDLLLRNANALGVPLSDVGYVALSHGHYDHTGGLLAFLQRSRRRIKVFAHPDAFTNPHFICGKNGERREIGIPFSERDISEYADIIKDSEAREILPGIVLSGEIKRITPYEDVGKGFFLDEECLKPDPIRDDQALFLDTREGILILFGCGHSGIVNTLYRARELFPKKRIRGIMGGFHLEDASDERLERTIEELKRMEVKEILPGHCTGWKALCRFAQQEDWATIPLFVGLRYIF